MPRDRFMHDSMQIIGKSNIIASDSIVFATIISAMRSADRHNALLETLSTNGSIGVGEIAGQLGVTATTVRRDLRLLEERGLLMRMHGGAMANSGLYELPLRLKRKQHPQEKVRIARAAAERVQDGSSVALTGGTTTTEVARALAGRRGLTIVTTALDIASQLAVRPNLKLLVTGGLARGQSYELVGPLAEATLRGLNLDVAIVGADGVSAQGLTTHDHVEAHTDQVLISRARRVIVVADSSKLGRTALAQMCSIETVDELITDSAAPPAEVAALEAAGVLVTLV
jgi:DeoR family transcriptional regulator, aga operon transcriptional repressor